MKYISNSYDREKYSYDILKKAYDSEIFKCEKEYFIEKIIMPNITTRMIIVDIGCGIGFVIKKLYKMIDDSSMIVGLDITMNSIMYAKNEFGLNNLLLSNNYYIPLKDGSVDLVICSEVIEHLHDPKKSLSEMYRVLRKSGTLILSTPNGLYVKLFHHRKFVCLDHINEFTFFDIKKMLKNNNFKIVYSESSYLPFFGKKKINKVFRWISSIFGTGSIYIIAQKT